MKEFPEMVFEKSEATTEHEIKSKNILTCCDTGRVVAVFYNDYDLDKVIEEMIEARSEY